MDRVWVNIGGLDRTRITRAGPFGRIFFKPPTLMAGSSAVLWPTKTHSTSLERSKPLLLTQTLSQSLAALLVYFISIQSTLISIGFISKGAVFVGPICSNSPLSSKKSCECGWKCRCLHYLWSDWAHILYVRFLQLLCFKYELNVVIENDKLIPGVNPPTPLFGKEWSTCMEQR